MDKSGGEITSDVEFIAVESDQHGVGRVAPRIRERFIKCEGCLIEILKAYRVQLAAYFPRSM